MLLLVVLSTAAIFTPTLSQPTRSDVSEEGDYPMPVYRERNEWGEAVERPYKGIDAGHLLRDLEALRLSSLYSQPRRGGRFGEPLGYQLLKASKKLDGLRFAADKRNFDEIDRSGFNGFIKRNFDEIDRSGFNSLVKKNFDEIDRSAFNGFVKRSANYFDSQNH